MSDIRVRGYTILKAAEYLQTTATADNQESRHAVDGLSAPLKDALRTATAASWLPVSHVSEVFRAIASLGKGDEQRSKDILIGCGTYLGTEATNTFLRLVMRMLTPGIFAKKLPSFWSRDSTGGRYEVELGEHKMVCRLLEMEEFHHITPVSVGYVTFALRAMGKTVERTTLHGWSLATPSASTTWYEVHWKS